MGIFLFGILIAIPIKIQGLIHINGVDKKGFYSLRLLFINLACGKIALNEDFQFSTDTITSDLMKSDETNAEKTRFVSHLIDKLKLAKFELFIDGGDKENAFLTAMTIGAAYSFGVALIAVLNRKNKTIEPTVKISPNYTEDEFLITGKFFIYVSLVDIIISKLQSIR